MVVVVVVMMIAPKCDDHRRQWQQQQHQQVIFHHHFQLSSSSLPAATARNMRHVAAFDFWDDDADADDADAGGGTRPGRDTSYCVFSLLGRDKGQNKTVREVIYQLKSDPRPDKIRSRRYSFLSFLSFSLFWHLTDRFLSGSSSSSSVDTNQRTHRGTHRHRQNRSPMRSLASM